MVEDTLKVEDCMSLQYISFKATMPVIEAANLLCENELLGGPVVDDEGRLTGWISEQDCLNAVNQLYYFDEQSATVADVMRTDVLTVRRDLSLNDLASQMCAQKPKIYPVVDDHGKVLGVISRRRILKKMCHQIVHKKKVPAQHTA